MFNIELLIAMYLWFNFGAILIFKLLYIDYKIPKYLKITLYLLLPLLLIDTVLTYIIRKILGARIMNFNKMKRSVLNIIDKVAIRFINALDRVRGTYQ